MQIEQKSGQYLVTGPGIPGTLRLPGTMDEQTVARVVMQEYGDAIRAEHEKRKRMGVPSPMESATLKAGQTGEMLWDFMNKPRFGTGSPERLAEFDQRAEDRAAVSQYLDQFNPVETMVGGAAPYFAIPAGAGSRPVQGLLELIGLKGVGERVGQSATLDMAAQGGLLGAASDEGSAIEGAAYGGTGGFLAQALSRLLRPADTSLDPATAATLSRGQDLGYTISPAQATGSKPLSWLEDAMENNILTGGGLARIQERNQANSNRIVAEALGFQGPRRSDKITPGMIDQVSDRFDQQFSDITQGQAVRLDSDEFIDQLARMEAENVNYPLYNKDFADTINRTLDLIVSNDGWLTGEQYQTLSSKLVKGIRAGYKPGSGQADFAGQLVELKDALDEAAVASLGTDALERFRSVRSDYRTFANLMKNSVINEDTGDVSLRQLGNVLRRDDRYGYRRGKNTSDLYDATRFTRATLGDGVNSLTARRMSLPNVLMGSAMLGAAGYGATGEAEAGIGAAAGIPMSMLLFGKYYNSPMGRRHFGKGLLPPISDDFRRHLGQKIGAAAIAGSNQGLLPAIQ